MNALEAQHLAVPDDAYLPLRQLLKRGRFTEETWARFAACDQPHYFPAVGPSKQVLDLCFEEAYNKRYATMAHHIATISTLGNLHKLYPAEYNSYRSRKQSGSYFDHKFHDFQNWLVHLGPRPAPSWTVDNIQCSRKQGYRPGNVRWLDKRGQRRNQKRARGLLRLPDGQVCSIKRLAQLTGRKPNTVAQQLGRGWSVERILEDSSDYPAAWRIPAHMTTLIKECRKRRRPREDQLDCCIRITKENLADPSVLRVAGVEGLAAMQAQLKWLEQQAEEVRKQQRADCDRIAAGFIDDAMGLVERIRQSSDTEPYEGVNDVPVADPAFADEQPQ